MRLTGFIRNHMEDILRVWEHDARATFPRRNLTREELRDHVEQMLWGIVAELDRPECGNDRASTFNADQPDSQTYARFHGVERQKLGADIVHVAAEFRGLRMTVVELWAQMESEFEPADIDDLIRFNNEIDKALAQSIECYALEKQKQGRLFETMLSSLPNPCYILGLDGTFLYANRAMADLCDLPATDIVGTTFSEMQLPSHYKGEEQIQEVINDKKTRRGEVEIRARDGTLHFFEYVYAPVMDDDGRVEAVSGIAHDVTARKEAEAEIWRHANYDMLTNLPNRRLFLDRLDQHVAHSRRTGDPFALLFIDLDHFKDINDRLGHSVGDKLLNFLGKRIDGCVRQSDTVARIGGDEFTVLLLDTGNLELIKGIAGNILAEVERPFRLEQDEVRVSGSVGITLFPEDASTAQELLSHADQAMYLAKNSGRNQLCFFTEIMREARSARQKLISELREAPQRQQLKLYYQPIVDLSDGRIVKAEALLRWQHPEKGLLLPREFFDLAEKAGLMPDLEDWVFAEAASFLERWVDSLEQPFQLTINISPMQFMHSSHKKPWEPHLETFARSGTDIAIELTENVFLHESEYLKSRFSELKAANIQLVLDDFGTGYSSMAYLKRFDVNYLKIDQSFVRDNTPGSSNRTIAETIIMMAHKLGLLVVAEGVETEEQRDWLKGAGCDFAQGFFFSEPLSPQALGELLQAGRTSSPGEGARVSHQQRPER